MFIDDVRAGNDTELLANQCSWLATRAPRQSQFFTEPGVCGISDRVLPLT